MILRVLLVVNTLPPTDISGVGEQVLQLADGLRKRGHHVEILGRGPTGARGPKFLFPLAVLPVFLRKCRSFRPDVVQVHESDGGIAALILKTIAATLKPVPRLIALLQVSYVEEIRSVRSIREKGKILGSPGVRERVFCLAKGPIQVVLGCLSGWLADLVIAPSRQTASEIQRDYGLSDVRVIPNVTRSSQPESSSEDPIEDAYFLFVGRLRVRKGVEILLHAIHKARTSYPDIRLVIAGDGEHRGRLESAVRELGLAEEVTFLGTCGRDQIARLMACATALVVPSLYEGMPLVILEAMSHSLPVVGSRVSGIPEVVEHGVTGWLVPSEDVPALAEVLEHILSSPAEAKRRGRIAKNWVETNASPIRAADSWLYELNERFGKMNSK